MERDEARELYRTLRGEFDTQSKTNKTLRELASQLAQERDSMLARIVNLERSLERARKTREI
jgi:uncharacterized coiled-coil DUF342 family protein